MNVRSCVRQMVLILDYARDAYRVEVEGLCDDISALSPTEYETQTEIAQYVDRLYAVGEAIGLLLEQAVAEEHGAHPVGRLIEAVRRCRPEAFTSASNRST